MAEAAIGTQEGSGTGDWGPLVVALVVAGARCTGDCYLHNCTLNPNCIVSPHPDGFRGINN